MIERRRLRGITLVELLVVIAIIGALVAMLLPAVQAAREAARRMQCKNHLRQLALASLNHHEAIGHFPTGGWGAAWVGDKDRGSGELQPGGWTFNILPFLEENNLYDLAGDGVPDRVTPEQKQGAKRLIEAPISIINCPSRRSAALYPGGFSVEIYNADFSGVTGRTDYAICVGDVYDTSHRNGPRNVASYHSEQWTYTTLGFPLEPGSGQVSRLTGDRGMNGVSFERSQVGFRHVSDGTSNTYLVGEKYLDPAHYENGQDPGDEDTWITGYSNESYRTGHSPPLQDEYGLRMVPAFGSAHSSGLHMAYCDGSVRVVEYGVDQTVHMAAANRHDGTVHGIGQSILDEPAPPPPRPRPPR